MRFYTQQAQQQQQQEAVKSSSSSSVGTIFAMIVGLAAGGAAATFYDAKPLFGMPSQQDESQQLKQQIIDLNNKMRKSTSDYQSEVSRLQRVVQDKDAKVASLQAEVDTIATTDEGKKMFTRIVDNPKDKDEIQTLRKQLAAVLDQLSSKDTQSVAERSRLLNDVEILSAQYKQNLKDQEEKFKKTMQELAEQNIKETDSKLQDQSKQLRDEAEKQLAEAQEEFKKVLDLEKQVSDNLTKELLQEQEHTLNMSYQAENKERVEKLADLTTHVMSLSLSYSANVGMLDESYQLAKLTGAILNFQNILNTNAPFKPELDTLRSIAKDDELVATVLNAIPQAVTLNGIKKVTELSNDFQSLVNDALTASFYVHNGLAGWLYAQTSNLFVFREHGLVQGTTVNSKLARAEFYLEHGKLEQAVQELDTLEGEPRKVLENWLVNAKHRLLVQQACGILDSHLSNLRCSVLE